MTEAQVTNNTVQYNVDASSNDAFKARLDKSWLHKAVIYDFTADQN